MHHEIRNEIISTKENYDLMGADLQYRDKCNSNVLWASLLQRANET